MSIVENISTDELIADLDASERDLQLCQIAYERFGIVEYGNGSKVMDRIEGNRRIIKVIREELDRRSGV